MTDERNPRFQLQWYKRDSFNRVYRLGRLVVQLKLRRFEPFQLEILPTCLVASNDKVIAGIEFCWLFSTLAFGYATDRLMQDEDRRLEAQAKNAKEIGITVKQYQELL